MHRIQRTIQARQRRRRIRVREQLSNRDHITRRNPVPAHLPIR